MSFHSLEHRLIRFLKKEYGQEKKDYRLFCSGGLDSVCLFHLLKNVKPVFDYTLKVIYVHHGFSSNDTEQSEYRDKAKFFVEDLCSEFNIDFECFKSEAFLKSEEECRNFRLELYNKCRSKGDRVFLAHHQDDLFETLLLRLIRGTGPEGLAAPFSSDIERPLVAFSDRKELEDYQKEVGFKFIEDPSNQETDYLRNWLRHSWLSDLEKKGHGLKPFKESMLRVSEALSQTGSKFMQSIEFEEENKGFFNAHDYFSLNQVQKKSFITHILHSLKKSGYTSGQVLEVVKLLEHKEQNMSFKISAVNWTKTPTKVCFERV